MAKDALCVKEEEVAEVMMTKTIRARGGQSSVCNRAMQNWRASVQILCVNFGMDLKLLLFYGFKRLSCSVKIWLLSFLSLKGFILFNLMLAFYRMES